MMSEEYYTTNLKKLNIEKHETIGGLDLPKGRELKEEVIENSQKITTQQKWYRWRADKLSAAAAAARRSTKVGGGGAHKLSAAAAWRGRRTALLELKSRSWLSVTVSQNGKETQSFGVYYFIKRPDFIASCWCSLADKNRNMLRNKF